ncbi:MAG: MarR family transcriptional regulator [bacterium]|nr:MarR family transcriptional regulator [bacterium]
MLSTYKTGLLQAKSYRMLKSYLSSQLSEYSLTMPQWAFLGLIYDARTMRLSEIAQILDVEAPFATNLADQLQKKGLIKRTESKEDRRAKAVTLTKKGDTLIPVVEEKVKDAMRKIYKSISPEDLGTYLRVLSAITTEYTA